MQKGQLIDRYRIESLIHEGEFTYVYEARHQVLGSRHAIKVQNDDVPDEIPDSLLQEARLQSTVTHRNVLGVTDAFDWQGRVVIVMNHVRSESLADLLEQGHNIPLRPALTFFRGVVRGVRAMHHLNVVHRDLKPENILLARLGDKVLPKICDFGLAKLLDPNRPPEPEGLSMAFRYLGTPEYMAPEQAQDPGRVDTRADLFSLGALLYELSTGQIAFDAEEPVEAMYLAAKGEYVDPKEAAPNLPDPLVDVIKHLLQPRPKKRMANCDELLGRLEPFA